MLEKNPVDANEPAATIFTIEIHATGKYIGIKLQK